MRAGLEITIGRALFVAVTVGLAGAAQYDPAEVLKRVTAKVLASCRNVPNYTCVQTVTRDYYRPAAAQLPRSCDVLMQLKRHPTLDMVLRLNVTDRLRMDVTLTKRGEIYSWVGASKFDDAGIEHLVREGPIGSGAFGGFLDAIFTEDAKTYPFQRETVIDGRRLLEYSFHVPQADSHYKVKLWNTNSWAYVAYGGTFIADPETGDLVRLTVETFDMPSDCGSCSSTSIMDYAMVRLGNAAFLLPNHASQRWVALDGSETENTTGFSNCREYLGESTVTFLEEGSADAGASKTIAPDPGAGKTTAPAAPLRVPPGLTFGFELTSAIDSDKAAAGDPFTGRLVAPLRQGRTVLAPKGAVVEGRLIRVQTFHAPSKGVIIVLRPEKLEIKGSKVPLTAIPDWRPMTAQNRDKRFAITLPLLSEEHSALFRFAGSERFTVPKGFRSEWRTQN